MIMKNMNVNHLQVVAGPGLDQISGIRDPKLVGLIIRDPDLGVEVSALRAYELLSMQN